MLTIRKEAYRHQGVSDMAPKECLTVGDNVRWHGISSQGRYMTSKLYTKLGIAAPRGWGMPLDFIIMW